jgi:hypothetical protein
MIDDVLLDSCGEYVAIYRNTSTINSSTGAETTTSNLVVSNVLCQVQSLSSNNNQAGVIVEKLSSGDRIKEINKWYSSYMGILEKDIIVRSNGIRYEAQAVSYNGVNTPLEHTKAYLVRIDEQI